MRYHLFVDVSGRIEKRTRKDAALAFSDGIEASVFVSGKVKLAVNDELATWGMPRKRRGARILVAGLYLLLEDFLGQVDHVVIDDELPGWGDEIKRELLGLIRQQIPAFEKFRIDVRPFGKGDQAKRADRLAWLTRKKKEEPHKSLTFEDLISVIKRIQ